MQKDTIIYVTDQRQKYLADMLNGEKESCHGDKIRDYARVGNIIFPTPFSKLRLSDDEMEKLKQNIIKHDIAVWGGVMPECFPGVDKGGDFMRDEQVIMENAVVTAEAVISIAVQKSLYSIERSKVLVCGFGRCGRALAARFKALGADVMVMARRKEVREAARQQGYEAVGFDEAAKACFNTRILINTVPAQVIDENIIRILLKDTLVIDIASKPGGCDFEAAKRYRINCVHALGLPGIYCPKTSAGIFLEYLKRKGMEDALWILEIAR